jgi:predicted CoA-binding protein
VPIEDDRILETILRQSKTIAVVGASPKPGRDSGSITQFLISEGYEVHPVNPNYKDMFGRNCYPDLKSVPGKIDIVNVFRNPDELADVVDEAIAVKAKTLWLQYGVINQNAAAKAEQAGLQVVMDHCIAVDHRRLRS